MKGSAQEEGPGAGKLNRILEGKVRDEHGKYGIRKCKREGSTWEEKVEGRERKCAGGGPGVGTWQMGMLNRILGEEVRDKAGSTGN